MYWNKLCCPLHTCTAQYKPNYCFYMSFSHNTYLLTQYWLHHSCIWQAAVQTLELVKIGIALEKACHLLVTVQVLEDQDKLDAGQGLPDTSLYMNIRYIFCLGTTSRRHFVYTITCFQLLKQMSPKMCCLLNVDSLKEKRVCTKILHYYWALL